jgi:hypothetical protein
MFSLNYHSVASFLSLPICLFASSSSPFPYHPHFHCCTDATTFVLYRITNLHSGRTLLLSSTKRPQPLLQLTLDNPPEPMAADVTFYGHNNFIIRPIYCCTDQPHIQRLLHQAISEERQRFYVRIAAAPYNTFALAPFCGSHDDPLIPQRAGQMPQTASPVRNFHTP